MADLKQNKYELYDMTLQTWNIGLQLPGVKAKIEME